MTPAEAVLAAAAQVVDVELDRLLAIAEGPDYVSFKEELD